MGLLEDFSGSVNQLFKGWGDAFTKNFDTNYIRSVAEEMDNIAVSIANTFGQGRESVLEITRAMADAAISVEKLGGGFSDLEVIQRSIGQELGRNVIVMSDAYDDLYATAEVAGQEVGTLVSTFKNVGVSAYDVGKNMQIVMDTVRQTGANAKGVTDAVIKNMDYMNKINFQNGVEGLAKMAAQAVKLRVDMGATLRLSEDLLNPERAIELAASLQRLGVANSELLDPLRLMDLAQNDPTELQNQIAKMSEQFVKLNEKGQFEILPGAKRQLKEIENALMYPSGTLSKMALSAAETQDKLNKIKFPEGAFTEEQKNLIASMAEMESGEYKLQLGGETLGLDEAISRLQGDKDLMMKFEEMAQPKSMEELAMEQNTLQEQANSYLKTISDRLPLAIAGMEMTKEAMEAPVLLTKAISQSLEVEMLSVKNLRENLGGGIEGAIDGLNGLLTGEKSLEDIFSGLGDTVEKGKVSMGKLFEELEISTRKQTEKLTESGNSFITIIEILGKKIAEIEGLNPKETEQAKDFIITKGKVIETHPEDTIFGGTGAEDFLKQIRGGGMMTSLSNNVNVSGGMTLTIDVKAPPHIDTQQIKMALETTELTQYIAKQVSDSLFDRDRRNANPQRQFQTARQTALNA